MFRSYMTIIRSVRAVIYTFVCNCLFVFTNGIPFVSQFLSASLVKITVFVYCKIIKLNYSKLI
jgi:hypothetical protein